MAGNHAMAVKPSQLLAAEHCHLLDIAIPSLQRQIDMPVNESNFDLPLADTYGLYRLDKRLLQMTVIIQVFGLVGLDRHVCKSSLIILIRSQEAVSQGEKAPKMV